MKSPALGFMLLEAITLATLGGGVGLLYSFVDKNPKLPLYFALGAVGSSIVWHQIMNHPISYEHYRVISA